MKKVLVIGGNGFIGRNIIQNMKKHQLYVASYDLTENLEANKNHLGNITDDRNFEDIISFYDIIIYLITTVSPKESMDIPESTYVNDIPLLLKTLDACLKNKIKRIIFSSSGGTIYGEGFGKKSKEIDFNEPINHYAVCKLTCEKILEMYNILYGMENISLRIANPFGKGQNPSSGIGVITAIISQIQKQGTINIYGDGSVTRDFVDVSDVAESFYLATTWSYDSTITPVFNIGSGVGLSLNDLIEIIQSTLHKVPLIQHLPKRDFDVSYNVLNIDKACQHLNYKPSGNIKDNIIHYINHICENNI